MKKGRDVQTLGSCTLIDYFKNIRENAILLAASEIAPEIIRKTIHAEAPSPRLFNLLKAYLGRLNRTQLTDREYIEKLIWMFILNFLKVMGFAPVFNACTKCGSISFNTNMMVSPLAGGVLCADCGLGVQHGTWVPIEAISQLDKLSTLKIENVGDMKITQRDLINRILLEFLSTHFEKNMKLNSLEFYYRC
jgi:DNA repair protein RecO (recombination protein O)